MGHDSKVPTADFASNDQNLGRSSMWHQLIWGDINIIVQDRLGDSPSLGPSDLSGSALPSQRHFLFSRVKPKKESVPGETPLIGRECLNIRCGVSVDTRLTPGSFDPVKPQPLSTLPYWGLEELITEVSKSPKS
ncbi:uncharacterized protein APUU_60205A [Aspergillus puulaauensis]|uniref:Uncharacterized protein n=1 Tax=Aspergillus puulaauensis TaxID=1220207 RepID=A0A7R7XSX7_9EURO|nr:uncharacterized protein APUU_60205A [Aspergillus puulaauensis]BCS27157.1 hypothetical protein APUU_60205A [Aspergillus puulaauensis]